MKHDEDNIEVESGVVGTLVVRIQVEEDELEKRSTPIFFT